MKKDRIEVEFDEQILKPEGDEIVCPIYTIPLNEFRLRDFCKENGIVSYLPLKKIWKVNEFLKNGKPYKQRQLVLRPMFPSYIFVKLQKQQQQAIWNSHSIVRFLYPSTQESFLNDIRAVRSLELTGLSQEIEFNAEISEGDRFVIESGIWEGVTGWLKKKDKRFLWTVELEFINQFVSTTIDPSGLKMTRLV